MLDRHDFEACVCYHCMKGMCVDIAAVRRLLVIVVLLLYLRRDRQSAKSLAAAAPPLPCAGQIAMNIGYLVLLYFAGIKKR